MNSSILRKSICAVLLIGFGFCISFGQEQKIPVNVHGPLDNYTPSRVEWVALKLQAHFGGWRHGEGIKFVFNDKGDELRIQLIYTRDAQPKNIEDELKHYTSLCKVMANSFGISNVKIVVTRHLLK